MEGKEAIQSGVCYLPDAFQSAIVDQLGGFDESSGEVGEKQVESVQIAVEIGLQRATNPQGYSWMLRNLTEPTEHDPLAELRKALPNDTKAIPDNSKAKKEKAS